MMRFGERLTLLPAALLVLAMFAVPVAFVFAEAIFTPGFSLAHFDRFFSRPVYLSVYLNTLVVSAVVASICLVIGYPMALFIVSQPPARRPLLLFLVLVPLWMSILVRTYAWMVVLGREGIINGALQWAGLTDGPLTLMFTTGAVFVAMVQILLPIMVITCYSIMTEIDPTLVRAARICGASGLAAFRKVFLPLSMEGAITGWSVIFILSMGFFIVPALVGGRRDVLLGNMIVNQVGQANWGFAGALAIILLVSTIVLLGLVRLVMGRFVYSPREAQA
ncbi:ABC transporter permease subunit [Chelativorans sp. ZYF759]|uniref:ABC transporter permease n=1 Tax=Chelativorans sp. ZYF759 TaxID=2692213 RepID=UPI00145EA17A|nr:ABC transporter permease [Chelativorans sp. ZYF759]NMG39716.1 ABC transporter permease subunit [Chelativorans sp. ZYF759]